MRKPIYIALMLLAASCSQSRKPTLAFYVVAPEKIAEGRFINTPDLPNVGYISRTPDLEVRSIKEVYPQNGSGRFTLALAFNSSDASRFADLTGKAIDKRLLIMLGDRPLSAPKIMAQISGGRIGIDFANETDETKTEQELKKLLEPAGG